MGLIKAGIGATGGTLADQWKEYFYCESMSKDVLATKGQKPASETVEKPGSTGYGYEQSAQAWYAYQPNLCMGNFPFCI